MRPRLHAAEWKRSPEAGGPADVAHGGSIAVNHIGIAVPTLNAGGTLPWTLLSLRQQVGCEVSAVVVDSGSTDATLAECVSAGVRTLFEPPGNLYRAVNAGVRALESAWCGYLNADDVAYCDAYATLIAAGERSGADVVYGDCDHVDRHGRFLFSTHAAPPRLLRSMYAAGIMPFNQPCAVFRRALFDRLGGFDHHYRQIADLDFFSRAAEVGARFEQVAGFPVVAYRMHPGQFSFRERAIARDEVARFLSIRTRSHSWTSPLAGWQWRIVNVSQYLIRRLRTGRWGDRPAEDRSGNSGGFDGR